MARIDPIVFPVEVAMTFEAVPEHDTTIISVSRGRETANGNRPRPIRRFTATVETADALGGLDGLQDFIDARWGMLYGFLFRDWTNFHVGMRWDDDTLVYDAPKTFAVGDGVTTVFQLTKVGSDPIRTVVRPITRPEAGTVRVFQNGTRLTSGFTVDHDTGKVTFASIPPSGAVLAWQGKFFVPVRFGSDAPRFRTDGPRVISLDNLEFVELLE